MGERKAITKKRNWAFVAYPESMSKEFLVEKLQKTGLQCVISPLHDSDVNADESEKKPHWHIILCYSGPTAYNVVAKLTASLNSTVPQALEQIKGYYRYLTHKDNPEKKQYNESDIVAINGFSIRDYTEMSKSEIFSAKMQIIDYVESNDITEYCDLLRELKQAELYDMCEVAANNTIFADAYIRSRRHKLEKIARDEECSKNQLQAPPGHKK
jgi:hypothetical protein